MTPPRSGRRGARGRTRTPDVRLRKPALCPLSYARWCSLTSSRRDARRPGALGGSRTPVSASVERRRVRWTTKAVLFTAGARQMRADGDGEEWRRDKCTLRGAHSRTRKRPPRRCPGTACRTTLWSDDRTAGVAGEERGHAEIRHGQRDVRLLAGQHGTSPVLLDGFAHGTAPLGHVGWPTHRNVVDRGRPYAPFPIGTTPFPEFDRNSSAEAQRAGRGPTGRRLFQPDAELVRPARGGIPGSRADLRTRQAAASPRPGSAGRSRTEAGAAWHTFSAGVPIPAFRTTDQGCRRHPVGFRTFRTHIPTPTNHAAGPTTGDPPP